MIHRKSRCFFMNKRASSQPSIAMTMSLSNAMVCEVNIVNSEWGEWSIAFENA